MDTQETQFELKAYIDHEWKTVSTRAETRTEYVRIIDVLKEAGIEASLYSITTTVTCRLEYTNAPERDS